MIKSIGHKTRAGSNPDGNRKINQDSYLYLQNILKINDFNIFGVFDGHGAHGHFISNAVKNFFTEFFSEYAELYTSGNNKKMSLESVYKILTLNDYQIIKLSFLKAEHDLSTLNYDSHFSGTTCVMVFQLGKRLICANAGDSRAIAFGENSLLELSRDHKADLPDENKRILECNGRVEPYIIDGEEVGPHRVWLKDEDLPGLAMSRSIGDLVAGTVGVTPEPEVKEFTFTEDIKAIFLASDGVWEFLSNEQVQKKVLQHFSSGSPSKALEDIVNESLKEWVEVPF